MGWGQLSKVKDHPVMVAFKAGKPKRGGNFNTDGRRVNSYATMIAFRTSDGIYHFVLPPELGGPNWSLSSSAHQRSVRESLKDLKHVAYGDKEYARFQDVLQLDRQLEAHL